MQLFPAKSETILTDPCLLTVHDRRPRAARAWQMVHRRATPLPASPGRRSVAACARRSSLGRRRQAQPPAALPPHGCPVAAQPKTLHTWHSRVRSTPSRHTIASPKSVTARLLGFGNLGLGETKVRRRGKMARGDFRLPGRCVLLCLDVPKEGGGSATAAGSGHGEEGARMRWAVRREAQPSRAIEALGKDFFAFLDLGIGIRLLVDHLGRGTSLRC